MKRTWMLTASLWLAACGADGAGPDIDVRTQGPTGPVVMANNTVDPDPNNVVAPDPNNVVDPEPNNVVDPDPTTNNQPDPNNQNPEPEVPTYGEWYEVFGGEGAEIAQAVTADADGNVYVTGKFTGTIAIGTESLTSRGDADVFVASYSPEQEFRWARSFGSDVYDSAHDIAVTEQGAVYIVGDTQGELVVGTSIVPHLGQSDIFAVKLDGDGNFGWAQSWGGPYSESPRAITVNDAGDLFITGSWQGIFSAGNTTYNAATDWSAMEVITFAIDGSTGAARWATSFEGFLIDTGTAIAADDGGGVAVGVSLQYDLQVGDVLLDAGGEAFDAAVVRLDGAGDVLWVREIAGPRGEEVLGLAIDANDNVYATGVFSESVELGSVTLVNPLPGHDIFVAAWDIAGTPLWANAYGDAGFDQPLDMALRDDIVYITGRYDDVLDLGGHELRSLSEEYDIFVGAIGTADGKVRWARTFGGELADQANSITTDGGRGIYVAGYSNGPFMFDDQMMPPAATEIDAFVMRLEAP